MTHPPNLEEPAISERPSESFRGFKDRPSLIERLVTQPRPRLGLFALATLVVLYATRSVAVPLLFGLMLYFTLRPSVRLLGRAKIPSPVGAALVLGAVVGVLGLGVVQLSGPASSWAERLPVAVRQFEFKSRALRAPVERASRLAEKVESVASLGSGAHLPQVELVKPGLFDVVVDGALQLAAQLLVLLITAYFLLIDGDALLRRLFQLVPDLGDRERATVVIGKVEQRMSLYLRTVTGINLGLGICLGLMLELANMPNPWLWGGMAAVLNYVPYIGPALGIGVVGLASFVTFDSTSAALAPPLLYLGLTTVEGNIITPLILGRTFRISALVVFVWLVFWAWLWDVAGAILAVPLLMFINIVCEQSPTLAGIPRLIRR